MLNKIGKWYSEVFLYKGAFSLSLLARIALVVMMLTNLVTVIIRKGLTTFGITATGPMVGAFELTEVAMVFLVAGAGAWTWYKGGHIRIGIIPDRLKERPRAILTACSIFLGMFFIAVVIWGMVLTIKQYTTFQVRTAILLMPLAPLATIFGILLAHIFLVLLRSFIGLVSKGMGKQFAREPYLKD